MARRVADAPGRLARALARRRVTLGFAGALVVVLLSLPTVATWTAGFVVALIGESIRLWAAGHLEKGREVTRSGPYRFVRHPLYVGSTIIAGGVALASHSSVVALVIALYMASTIAAAVRTEEADLRRAFGSTYDDYSASRAPAMSRRFSVARAIRNREHRAITGVGLGFALLGLKALALQ
jgi:protein-S-isoprenylcysteine O-methyltransferase Ste14